jgi:hypothetical protein
VKEQARAQGISPGRYVSRVLEETLGSARAQAQSDPFETGYGMGAKYGPAPSAEEIDENRRDMFRNFAKEFQVIAGVADTHAAVWYLFGDPRLSARANHFIDQAAANRRTIEVSPLKPGGSPLPRRKEEPSAGIGLRRFAERPRQPSACFQGGAAYRRRR